MTIVYDMAAGSIRSDAQGEHREDGHPDPHREIVPERPAPALQEVVAETTAVSDSIHLVRELLKQG